MPKFVLSATPRNLAIAKFLEKAASASVSATKNHITVSCGYGLNLQRLFLEKVVPDLTDKDWSTLHRAVRSTLSGGRITSQSELGLSIRPLKTRTIRLRVDPLEERIIREAAKEARKSLSDYIRGLVLHGAEIEEALQKDFERQTSANDMDKKKAYVG